MKKFEYTYKAIGTICSITIISENDNGLNNLINECYNKTIIFENELSRFKENSKLSLLNKSKKLEVSDDFLSLIYKSREIYKLTNGYFNPLIDVRKIGYSNSFEEKVFEKIDVDEDLSFDEVKNYGNLLEIGEFMNLDFGSIAKGYLAEKISHYITEKGYKNNLVNMGGDIYASGTNLDGNKWQIAIDSPFGGNEIEIIEISNSSISTSGTYLRNWEISGEKFHHIRNPFQDKQEDELVSVSIINNNGYFTDAIATAVIAMGKSKAVEFCEKNHIKYLFVLKNKKVLRNF